MNRGFAAGLRRSRFLPTLLLSLAACAGARGQAAARDFHIAAQDAASALAEFGAQSQMQLLFDYEAVQGVRTHALRGQGLSATDLDELWAGLVEDAVRRGRPTSDGKLTAQAWRHEAQEVIARVRQKVEAALGER